MSARISSSGRVSNKATPSPPVETKETTKVLWSSLCYDDTMKFIQHILTAPIRRTAIILGLSLVTSLVFTLTSFYLMRIMCADSFQATSFCRGTPFQMLLSTILNDLELVFRIATELSVIVLISQCVYRLTRK